MMDIKSAAKTLLEENNCPGITKYPTIPANLHIQVQNQVIHQEKKHCEASSGHGIPVSWLVFQGGPEKKSSVGLPSVPLCL